MGGMSGPASKFNGGGSRFAVGVGKVNGIDSFFQRGSKDDCIENVKFEIIKIKTGCHCIVHKQQRKAYWAAQNL